MARDLYARLFQSKYLLFKESKDSTQQTYKTSALDIHSTTIVETWPFCVSDVKGHRDSRHQVSFVWIIYQKPYRLLWQQLVLCHRLKSPRSIKLEFFYQSYVLETVQSTRIDRSFGRCTVHGLLPQCQMSEMLSLSSCWIMSNRIDESAPRQSTHSMTRNDQKLGLESR